MAAGSPALTEAVDIPQASLTADQQAGLNRHNYYRGLHQDTPSQSSDNVLCADATAYAQKLADLGKLQHDSSELNEKWQGENLYMAMSWMPFTDPGYERAVDKWYDEIAEYDYSNPTFTPGTGHFTQAEFQIHNDFEANNKPFSDRIRPISSQHQFENSS